MEKKPTAYKFIFIAFLCGIAIFSVYKYVAAVKEKNDLQASLEEVRGQVAVLEEEKQALSLTLAEEKELRDKLARENTGLQGTLQRIERELEQAKKSASDLAAQLSLMTAENTALKENEGKIKLRLEEITREKGAVEARLNSLAELKKAIRELKTRTRQMKSVFRKQERVPERKMLFEGNRGYLVKEGKTTHSSTVKIEVKPAGNPQ